MGNELSTTVNNVYPATAYYGNKAIPIFSESSVLYSRSKVLRYVTDEFIRACQSKTALVKEFYTSLRKMDDLDAKSLLYIKNFLISRSWENISLDRDDYKNMLIIYLKSCDNPLAKFNELITYKINNFLPEEYLGWFKNDLRCSLFIAYLLGEWMQNEAFKGRDELLDDVANFLRYNIHVFIVNYAKNMPTYSLMRSREGEWKTVDILFIKSVYFKNRLDCEGDIDWIDDTNTQQINWIYKYLNNESRQHIILNKVFFPQSLEEKYELILASLDVLSNVESPDIGTEKNKGFSPRAYILFSMEKAWRGRKQYANNKPSSDNDMVKISPKNIPKLKALMAYSDFTLKQIVNNSIEQMYDQLIINNSDTVDNDNPLT
jgi:hypothetical protein